MKITRKQLKRIIREMNDERESNFFNDGAREQMSSDILELIIAHLQIKFPDQTLFDEMVGDISDFLYNYEQQIKSNKGTFL